jgi:(5-formylfuran-3-yl)methyl phosphate synthase
MPELLVSVRNALEASAALGGGARLIDVKEPSAGALGRADDAAITAVIYLVDGRVPVSAALGELNLDPPPAGLAYVKWGLAGSGTAPNWRRRLTRAAEELAERHPATQPVAVAYADWQRATAPFPEAVCGFACDRGWKAFLIDTWSKDGTNLLDWLSLERLGRLREQSREAGVRLALAGSLGAEQIAVLRVIEPDWFAVRGAACRDGGRGGEIDEKRVRTLVECAQGFRVSTSAGSMSAHEIRARAGSHSP